MADDSLHFELHAQKNELMLRLCTGYTGTVPKLLPRPSPSGAAPMFSHNFNTPSS